MNRTTLTNALAPVSKAIAGGVAGLIAPHAGKLANGDAVVADLESLVASLIGAAIGAALAYFAPANKPKKGKRNAG